MIIESFFPVHFVIRQVDDLFERNSLFPVREEFVLLIAQYEFDVFVYQSYELGELFVFVTPEEVILKPLDGSFKELEIDIEPDSREFDECFKELVLFLGEDSAEYYELIVFDELVNFCVFALFDEFEK